MKATHGLTKAETLLLVEIEHYVETGKRPDGLQVTDEWIDESMKFLAGKLRLTLELWSMATDGWDSLIPTGIAARKLYRAWRGGRPLDALFAKLGEAIKNQKKSS